MTQDFAKIRPEPILERKPPVAAPPAWSLMLTGGVVGVTIGVFASFLFYLSGHVPPLNGTAPVPVVAYSDTAAETNSPQTPAAEAGVKFEFYSALPEYEVTVDATPVPVRDADAPLAISVVLQSGAFQQQELAHIEMRRQAALGLDVRVKQESTLPGRSLFLVQSGPYTTKRQLDAAELILNRNNIQSLRTTRQ